MECYKQGSKIGNMRGNGGKGTGIKKHNWQVQNRQGDVKNSVRNEAKELICMTHGHELRRWGILLEGEWVPGRGGQRGKIGTTVIA